MYIDNKAKIGSKVKYNGDQIYIDKFAVINNNCILENNVFVSKYTHVKENSRLTKSFPPYSILAGDPAILIGINKSPIENKINFKKILESTSKNNRKNRDQLIGLGDAKLYSLEKFQDARGQLFFGEFSRHIPFISPRFFYIKDVPASNFRGQHAHKLSKQFLCLIQGSINVFLDDGKKSINIEMNDPTLGLYIPEKVWGVQYSFSDNAVLLVMASDIYDEFDYINDYSQLK